MARKKLEESITGPSAEKSKLIKCNCVHEFQDKKYGENNRIHNTCKLGKAFRCTVCSKEKT